MESPGLEAELDPAQQKVIDRYNHVLEKLQDETAKTSADVLITVQDRDASVLQSRIEESGDAGPPLPAGGIEAQFGEGLTGGDVWGWIGSVFDRIRSERGVARSDRRGKNETLRKRQGRRSSPPSGGGNTLSSAA